MSVPCSVEVNTGAFTHAAACAVPASSSVVVRFMGTVSAVSISIIQLIRRISIILHILGILLIREFRGPQTTPC